MLGVFLDEGSLGQGDLDYASLRAVLPAWQFHEGTEPAQVDERIRNADVLITNKVRLNGEHLAGARCLRLVCVAATGTDNVDLEAARRLGIAVCNVRGYATASVSQHVFMLILALLRNLPGYREAVARGRWQQSRHFCLLDHPIAELDGKVLGIVGYGELGRAVARLGEAFGMTIRIAARPGTGSAGEGRVPLDALLRQVDVLSLHCPLAENTRGLIGARELALMKPGALLINTARGGIVDEQALAAALRAGHLGGAGVDVLSMEPPRGDHPLLAPDVPRLIVTPHIAWASREARQRLVEEMAENIRAWRAGRPRNLV
ncbi:MAG TPA: 2-hydroxyacid dehydrogenase [Gammaproteobacteria bacterium]|nr:2-hydroxyacid dehydrogenase [Gammaproteobacteria bacterium]